MLTELHPCVGVELWVFVTAVAHHQVETQDRGQHDIVRALVVFRLGLCVHLAIQIHPITFVITANG